MVSKSFDVSTSNGNTSLNDQYSVNSIENKGYGLENEEKDEESVYMENLENLEKVNVKRTVGPFGGISLIVGTMIGSGIFASAATVSRNSGSVGLSLIIWAASGVIATLGALCYIELGLMIPTSGGEYSYIMEAFGAVPAFLFVYTSNVLLKPASVAAIVIATGDYIVEPFYHGCSTSEKLVVAKIFSAFFLAIIVLVNCISVKWATKVQLIFTAAKLGAVALLIITGIVRVAHGYTSSFTEPFSGTNHHISQIGYAFYGGLWAYDGWNNLNYCVEELKDPKKDLPRSIIVGIPSVTVIYVLLNAAYLTVLTLDEINFSSAVAVTLGDRVYGVMAWIVPVLVACSTFGAANGVAFTGGRLVYVSAREGHMPKLLAMIHKTRYTPSPALLFTCIVAWIMLIPNSSNFEALITYFNFAAWIFYGLTFLSLIWLRFKRPELERPYKVFILVPVLLVLVSIYLVVAPFAENPYESLYCCIFIFTGIPLYLCFVKYQVFPKCCTDGIEYVSFKLQVLLNVVMPESELDIIE